jgi:hypothetical protein
MGVVMNPVITVYFEKQPLRRLKKAAGLILTADLYRLSIHHLLSRRHIMRGWIQVFDTNQQGKLLLMTHVIEHGGRVLSEQITDLTDKLMKKYDTVERIKGEILNKNRELRRERAIIAYHRWVMPDPEIVNVSKEQEGLIRSDLFHLKMALKTEKADSMTVFEKFTKAFEREIKL